MYVIIVYMVTYVIILQCKPIKYLLIEKFLSISKYCIIKCI